MQELVSGGCAFCSILYLYELDVIGEDFGPQLSLLCYDQAAASRSIQGNGRKWRPTFSYPFIQRSIFWICTMHHALSYMLGNTTVTKTVNPLREIPVFGGRWRSKTGIPSIEEVVGWGKGLRHKHAKTTVVKRSIWFNPVDWWCWFVS